ncbi:MATE family efflux transporter [Photobacterium kasasachensis]|uniref:MATE family efflux transporter n=1 Tax=Photobacterium kasasachensis TaxID=2910240 RepID=UPI003D14F63F
MQEKVTTDNSVNRTFWRYAIPSVVAMLVNGLYQVIDGIFVGHYIGFEGLAGINMAWPIIGVIVGLGLLVGMGSGSLISIYRGEGATDKARRTLTTGLGLILIAGVLMMALVSAFGPAMLIAQGAVGETLELGIEYIDIFSWGAIFTIAAGAMPMLIRNDDSPNFSTILMVIGALINIALDYLFIGRFGWGLEGAAIATIFSQVTVFVVAIGYYFSPFSQLRLSLGKLRFSPRLAAKSIGLGTSSLFMYAYFSFVIALHNRLFMEYGSSVHVGAFAIVGYLMTMYYLLAEGVAGGMQPPVSYYFGSGQMNKIKATLTLAIKVVLLTGISAVILLNLYPETMIGLFTSDDPVLISETTNGLRLHLFSMFLDGFIALASVYFMAVNQGGKALAISVGNMLIQLPFLYLLPQWLGIDGVWLSVPVSNVVLFTIVAPMVWKDIQGKNKVTPNLKLAECN